MLTPKETLKLSRVIEGAFKAIQHAAFVAHAPGHTGSEVDAADIAATLAQLKVGRMLIKLTDHTAPARVRKR